MPIGIKRWRRAGQTDIEGAVSDTDDISARMEALRDRLHAVHRVSGQDFSDALRRAGRLLPRGVRRDGAELERARAMFGHPRLERQIDFNALRAASRRIEAHLDGVDVADLRRGRILSLLGVLAFNLLVVMAGLLIWIVVTGQL